MPNGASQGIYIGLMSGTSLDGVDIAIVEFENNLPTPLACDTRPYPDSIRKRLADIIRADSVMLDELCRLDIELARFYAEIVNQTLDSASIANASIRAIGCHGQTIRHSPNIDPIYTLQIGDPNTLAVITGIETVADFRRKDMALGGQGAPLATGFHQAIFRSDEANRAIINIGGIANITYLPASHGDPVLGFDTGPGNTLLDYWINRSKGGKMDKSGTWAASGQVIGELLDNMLKTENYFEQAIPKTTGTEYFCPKWLETFDLERYSAADAQATLLELTARTITIGIESLPAIPQACFVCGGGVHNDFLMQRLKQLLTKTRLSSTNELSVNPDYVEAIAFAWLAQQTINQQPGNLPSVTNARRSAILGGIFAGSPEKT